MFSVLENQYQYPFSFLRLYQVFEIKRRTVRILLPSSGRKETVMFFDLQNFGMRVQEARMRKGLTQMALAATLDVNPQYCQRRNKKCLKRRPQNDPNAGNTYAG